MELIHSNSMSVLLKSFLNFLFLEFVKSKPLSFKVSLQNSTFYRGFQNYEFSEFFLGFYELSAKKVSLHG